MAQGSFCRVVSIRIQVFVGKGRIQSVPEALPSLHLLLLLSLLLEEAVDGFGCEVAMVPVQECNHSGYGVG